MLDRLRAWRYYRVLLWVCLAGSALVLLSWAPRVLVSSRLLASDDFVQYWSAGRLNAQGRNPYDPAAMAELQREAGRETYAADVATIAWNPPWTFALLMPLGMLDYSTARLVWWLLSLTLVFICAQWSWDAYGGRPDRRWVAWLLAFAFGPTLFALRVGQIGPLLLAGIVGVLQALRRERWGAAGAWAALLLIKPQLPFLILLILGLWVVANRRFTVVLGGAGALLLASAVALGANPAVFAQYAGALIAHPPADWATPTLGGVARLFLGMDRFWLQFVPPLFGAGWAAALWFRRGRAWDWLAEGPLLVAASLVTAAYAWTYDLVLLVLPLVSLVAWLVGSQQGRRLWWPLAAIAVLNGLYLVLAGRVSSDFWLFWLAPGFVLWYVLSLRSATPVRAGFDGTV